MSTGLFYVSAKALRSQPDAPSTLAISNFVKDNKQHLLVYDVMRAKSPREPPGIALSVLGALTEVKKESFQALKPLPPLLRNLLDNEPALEGGSGAREPKKAKELVDDAPLPPELQPELIDDDLPEGDPEDAIQDSSDGGLEKLAALKQCPDFDPNIHEDIQSTPAFSHSRTLESYDLVDMKNCDQWEPEWDPEAGNFSHDVNHAWTRADVEDCTKEAAPRLYEQLDMQIKPIENVIISRDLETKPLSSSSPLTPYLFLYQISSSTHLTSFGSDKAFQEIFSRFAYLTSHPHFRRVSAFKQYISSSTEIPHYLVLQEFAAIDMGEERRALKKREAEYWWRKNGWEGILVEFFIRRDWDK